MRLITETMWDQWQDGEFVGDDKPVTRAIIQKATLQKYGPWRSLNFGQTEPWHEILNLRTVSIDQRLQSDAGSLTLTFMNQIAVDVNANLDLTHSGQTPNPSTGPSVRDLKDLAQPGFFSYRRGITPDSATRWGHEHDPVWVDMFIPNRIIRTFQGYGTDGAPNAWDDEKLVLTGTWLIDNVQYSTSGLITVQCRDAMKLLIEQRLYPPIIPLKQYPLEFCAPFTETSLETVETETTTTENEIVGDDVAQHIASGFDSSVTPWYGYNGSVFGHRATHAFDGDTSSFWLSVGNSGPNKVWSFEWIGADCRAEPINQVHFKPKWGGYVCYVAVKEDGVWQGTNYVPYGKDSEPAYPNGSYKRYVKKVNVPQNEDWFDIDLDRTYNADQVLLIFTNLHDSGLGTYPYRAAVYEMQVRHVTFGGTSTLFHTEERETETIVAGNITDYTDIVKILASWSGFYWPYGISDPLHRSWEEELEADDPLATTGTGRTWGDFAYSGAFPVEPPCIPASFWDNKSVMDGINQIKEILGFICYADASGGLVWRIPNIWRTGNFVTGRGYIGHDSVRDVAEEEVLIDYGVTIDDQNLRSEIIVVSQDDPTLVTAIQPGWGKGETIPSAVQPGGDLALLGGQERIMLVPNYPFVSQDEVDKFAYLVSLWIHWSYRKSKFRIPGNPAFEPDDQIRIFERITSESYVHYIQGIRSEMNLDAGTWYLDVDTHWLGVGPDETWIINTYNDMPPALYAYLVSIGEISVDGDKSKLPDGFDPHYVYPDLQGDFPRVEDDYNDLFPSLPAILFPYDDWWSDFDIAIDIGSGYVFPPTSSGGGSVNARSEAWKHGFWGAPGSDLVTIGFLYKDSAFNRANIPLQTHVNQTTDVRTRVPAAAVPAIRLMAQQFAIEGYNVFSCTSFAGINRKIARTGILSAHAWGLAIDINPSVNGCCKTPWLTWIARPTSNAFYQAAQTIINNIRTKDTNTRVFGWGAYWQHKKDYMHIEIICTRSQILEGVVVL